MSGGAKRGPKMKGGDAEVDELLRQAEDDLLLKLSVNAHTVSDSSLDSDLARRFQSLKSPTAPALIASKPREGKGKPENEEDAERRRILGDDLSARFAALKGCSSEANQSPSQSKTMMEIGVSDAEDDEVEKVMRWAIDAARLNPSKGDEDEDDQDDDDDDDVEVSDDEDEKEDEIARREERNKSKGKPKKWFFF